MNDPNGLVYYQGVYHLFYQYNPFGNSWGNMSWGHATSTDLVHWTEQPVAIPNDDQEDIFTGSVVVDTNNTTGFGTAQNPAMVAIFTSAYKAGSYDGLQAQSLAYSLDKGQTWTKYSGNPVLNRNSSNFRDPKVFWYTGPSGSYWVMTAVEATQHQVVIYKSDDLKSWTYLSDFGPANATGGVWETPDLYPMQLDGDPSKVKWVLTVGLNPGAVAGGSGEQYFVGDFDGTTFTSEDTVDNSAIPAGTTYAGFDGADFGDWTATGTAFGSGPASGAVDGQQAVTGFDGSGFANSFHGGDASTGTLSSPTFTISKDYINFLIGGGNHPHVDGTQLANDPPTGSELLFNGFEYPDGQSVTDNGWTLSGDFTSALNPSTGGGTNYIGRKELNTFLGGPNGDANVGTMTSPAFTIDKRYLSMLLSGGYRTADSGQTLEVELVVDGNVVKTAAGKNDGDLNWQSWDLAAYQGQQAQLRVNDQATGSWGSLAIDNVVLADTAAQPHGGAETAVDLVVGGKVVRTATGSNAENLDWASWNVSDLVGAQATIELVDNSTAGWGHVNADQFMFSDKAQAPRLQNYNWVDWGRDFYAGNTFNDVPGGQRVMIAWMNNWDYGGDIPTSPWRSAMSLPRDIQLKTVDGTPQLVQEPVHQLDNIALGGETYQTGPTSIPEGTTPLPSAASGDVVRIDAVFSPGTATKFGLVVRRSNDGLEGTPIVYDTTTGKLSVDRTASGNIGFNGSFPSVDAAPVTLADGKLQLEIYLDKSSVETFAQGGVRSITDQIFPKDSSSGIALYAVGGQAQLDSLSVTPLQDAMWGANQTIAFGPIPDHVFGDADFAVTATASSGLPVSLAATGACTVTNDQVHVTGPGSCNVTASQPGDNNYNAAVPVVESFSIAPGEAAVSAPDVSTPWGVAAKVTVQVTSTAAAVSGQVQLAEGTTLRGTSTLLNGQAMFTLPIGLTGGTHQITVTYLGNGDLSSASTTVAVTVVLPPTWSNSTAYRTGSTVSLDGQVYTASWYTRGEKPGVSATGAWQQIAITEDGKTLWTASRIFQAGDQVVYQGKVFRAAWYSRNDLPGSTTGPWEEIATASDGTAIWTPTRIFQAGDQVLYDGQKYVAQWYNRNQAPSGTNRTWTVVKQL